MKIILSALLDQEQQTSFSQTECRFVNTAVLMKKKKNQLRMIEKSGIHIKCTFPAFLNKLDLTIGTNIAGLEWTENVFRVLHNYQPLLVTQKMTVFPMGLV